MKLYEFNVSDEHNLPLWNIDEIAHQSASEQEDLNCGYWAPDWKVVLESVSHVDSKRIYTFVVYGDYRYDCFPMGSEDVQEDEIDCLKEALENRESEIEYLKELLSAALALEEHPCLKTTQRFQTLYRELIDEVGFV